MSIRERIARKLVEFAIWLDHGNIMLCQAGKYKLIIGWQQPRSIDDGKTP